MGVGQKLFIMQFSLLLNMFSNFHNKVFGNTKQCVEERVCLCVGDGELFQRGTDGYGNGVGGRKALNSWRWVQGEVSFYHFPRNVLSPKLMNWLGYCWSLCWSRTRSAVWHGALSPADPAPMNPLGGQW